MKKWLWWVCILSSCSFEEVFKAEENDRYVGYVPTKQKKESFDFEVLFSGFPELHMPTKVEQLQHYLMVHEYGQGVHFYENLNPKAPVEIMFLKLEGSTDFRFVGDYMIMNQIRETVLFDKRKLLQALSSKTAVSFGPVERNGFILVNYPNYPAIRSVAFQCPDTTKGPVLGWKLDSLDKIECVR